MIANPKMSHLVTWWRCLLLMAVISATFFIPVRISAQEIKLADCPEPVQKRIRAEAGDGRIIEVEKESDDGKLYYEAEVVNGTNIYDVAVNEKGTLLSKLLARSVNKKDDDEGDDEGEDEGDKDKDEGDDKEDDNDEADDEDEGEDESQVLKMDALPANVRTTLERESKGGKIEEIERETEKGKVIYSAEVAYVIDGGDLDYEIEIAKDGTLLHKVLENQGDDDDSGDDRVADKIHGSWAVTSFTSDGTDVTEQTVKYQLVFMDDKYNWDAGPASEDGTFDLDAKTTPKTIELQIVHGNDEGKKQLGIYELSGDKLKICLSAVGDKERPKKFESKSGSGALMLELKREKEDDQKEDDEESDE